MKRALTACLMLCCVGAPIGCQSANVGGPSTVLGSTVRARPAEQVEVVHARPKLLPPREPVAEVDLLPRATAHAQEQPLFMPQVLPAGSGSQTIGLDMALAMAGADNPTVALALEAVTASQAQLLQAQALLLPTVNAGASFNWHEGKLQSVHGIIRNLDRSSVYAGAGAAAVGAGTVGVPGVRVFVHLGDAFLEPAAARRHVAGRQLDAQATRNSVLLEVATTWFALAGASARLGANRQSEAEFTEIARLTTVQAEAGQGKKADADRARTELLLVQAMGQQIEGEVAVAAADLARLLSVDPSVPLLAPPGPLPFLELNSPAESLESLIQIAIANRPEVAARGADVAVAQTRVRQEAIRPFVPILSAGYSAGGFGGGGNQVDPSFAPLRGRTDFDVSAVWTLQNFGLGNLALTRQRQAQLGEAGAERARVIDQVRAEVAEAHALVEARRHEMEVARRRMETSQRGLSADLTLAKNLGVLPIALLDSAGQLNHARQDFVLALAGFSQAQLQLFVALGQPPSLRP
jgi:outer membrane protein TolC